MADVISPFEEGPLLSWLLGGDLVLLVPWAPLSGLLPVLALAMLSLGAALTVVDYFLGRAVLVVNGRISNDG